MESNASTLHYKDYKFVVEYTPCKKTTKNTILLINGAMSSSSIFKNWKKYLEDKANFITFDFPFYGKSKEVNAAQELLTLTDEVNIIKKIIDAYQPNMLASLSWGGVETMSALGTVKHNIEKAIIVSFSFSINEAMKSYLAKAIQLIEKKKFLEFAELINNEVGEYLPEAARIANFNYLSDMNEKQSKQTLLHVEQISKIPVKNYVETINKNNCEFIFINGDLDKYTPFNGIYELCHEFKNTSFHKIQNAGHFIDLEGREIRKSFFQALDSVFLQDHMPIFDSEKSVIADPAQTKIEAKNSQHRLLLPL